MIARTTAFGLLLAASLAAQALTPGQAGGTLTVDGAAVTLAHATKTTRPNPFNDFFADTVVILSDRPVSEREAADDAALLARARKGELVAAAVRFDGRPRRGQLFNVAIFARDLAEPALLPDVFFTSTFKGGQGTLAMEPREFSGHRYAADARFAVTMPPPTTEAAAAVGGPALPPPSKTDADRQKAGLLLIEALQEGDEARALAILDLGVDPDVSDDKMKIPLINWAVLMCMPPVVRTLAVDLKADLTHVRIPGMTLLSEAIAACPEAVPALRQAGAQ